MLTLTLAGRSFGRISRLFFSTVAILAGFQVALILSAASVASDGSFEALARAVPAFVQAAIGPALTSFAGMTMLGYFDPVIVLMVVMFCVYVASEPAGDVEAGLVDLLLARPLGRHAIVGRSLVLMVGTLAGLVGGMGLSTWLGLALLAPEDVAWPERRTVIMMMAHLAAISWCLGGIGLAAAAWMSRRAAAVGLVALLAVSLLLLDVLVEFSARFHGLWWVTPFHYFHGAAILQNATDPVRNLTVLGGIGAVAASLAFWQFNRRDL